MKEYIFYRIVCKNPEITDCYVGSTTQINNRKWLHKKRCTTVNYIGHNTYVYQFIRENGDWSNWEIIEIERLVLETNQEALKQERFFLELYKATLNQVIPSRTKQEYRIENQQQIKEKSKTYYINNKQKIQERVENNKDYITDWKKKHYEKNKEKIKEQRKEKTTCQCGSIFLKCCIKQHEQSLKHQEFIKNNT